MALAGHGRAGAWLAASLLALAIPRHASADGRGPFAKGPYLHALSSDRVEVRVELDHAAPAIFEVTEEGAAKPDKRVESPSATFHVLAAKGLAPQKRYKYVVRLADSATQAASGSFTTAPKDDATQPFTFLVYGDNRNDHAAHAAVVRAMKNEPADFLVHTGDFVADGSSNEDWQQFFDVEGELLRDRCLFACVGNHELFDRSGTLFLRLIGPGAQLGEDKPKLYASVRWQNTRMFFLNFMTDDRPAEKAWLEDELARADKETGVTWRIVVMHHGPWSSGPHGNNKRLHDMSIPELLKKHKVDLVLSGHDHIYERGRADGMRYLVSGGGGAPPYEIKGTIPGSRKTEPSRHFVSFTVSPDAVKMVAKRADGSTLDLCGFERGATDWDCDRNVGSVNPAPSGAVNFTT